MSHLSMAAIQTSFLGPTTYRGDRIKATDGGHLDLPPRTLIRSWDFGISASENHRQTAQAWLDKYNPGNVVAFPGLGFQHRYLWTWAEAPKPHGADIGGADS